MQINIFGQLYSCVIFILVGSLIGVLFDAFRISRKTFKTSDFATNIEDIVFWILTGMLIIFALFKFNNGDIRGYIIISLILGILIYMLVFSKIVIDILVKVITILKSIFSFVFFKPIKYTINLFNIMTKPVIILQKNTIKKVKNVIKSKKDKNKSNYKKDFA